MGLVWGAYLDVPKLWICMAVGQKMVVLSKCVAVCEVFLVMHQAERAQMLLGVVCSQQQIFQLSESLRPNLLGPGLMQSSLMQSVPSMGQHTAGRVVCSLASVDRLRYMLRYDLLKSTPLHLYVCESHIAYSA